MQESQSQLVTELQHKTKQLERDNKLLLEKLELQSKSKQSEQGSLEKKLEKSLESEARLQEEVEQMKAERDAKIGEYQKMLAQERDNYKTKLKDVEGKGTSVQVRQTEILLGFEKERAKWEHEKAYLMNQKEDAVEAQQRLEKKVEMLLRENEKLKNDLRTNRKNMYQASANTSNFQAATVGANLLGKLGQYGLGKGNLASQSTALGAGGFGGLIKAAADGSATERSNFGLIASGSKDNAIDKSFSGLGSGMTHGAVGGLNVGSANLDSSMMNNILSTPSSEKSQGKNSRFSQEELKELKRE